MKLSQQTIAILNNFTKINRGLSIRPGNVLKTKSTAVYAEATVAEHFPSEAAFQDLPTFLSKLALFRDPVLDFAPGNVRITEGDGTAELKYTLAPTGFVQPSPKLKDRELPTDRFTALHW
jgi:hypothetical protein